MLEDHSSRWSAAASPGGMIAGVLTILSLIVAVGSALALLEVVQFEISSTVLSIILGAAAFLTLTFLYLLISYIRIGYTLDSSGLTMSWGLWRVHIPYNEIEAVESAADVLGEQDMGWQLFWPGYYVGTRKTDVGDIQVVATLPPRRQLLIARTDGVVFAISPERPLLFTEELIRWHRMFGDATAEPEPEPVAPPRKRRRPPQSVHVASQKSVRPVQQASTEQPPEQPRGQEAPIRSEPPPAPAVPTPRPAPRQERPVVAESSPTAEPERTSDPPEPEPAVPSFGFQQPVAPPAAPEPRPQRVQEELPPSTPVVQPAPGDQLIREPDPPRPIPEPPASPPGPVFGTSRPADQDPAGGQQFSTAAPAIAPAFGIPVHVELEPLPEPEIDPASEAPTAPYEVWFPDPPSEHEQQVSFTPEPSDLSKGPRSPIPFTAPKPVLAPSGRPRSEVLQPLTRVYRQAPDPVSPAIRPTLHLDSFAMMMAGIGFLSAVVMVGFITLQYDDIPASLTLHWNVDGLPGRIGEPQEIWILPVIAGLVLLANLGLAWSIAQFDRFAARLLVSSTLIVHIITWLALVMLLN